MVTTIEQPEAVAPRRDVVLTPDKIDSFSSSAAQRFDANLQAIRIVKTLEMEDRAATSEEREQLALYSGFGDSAFSDAFGKRLDYADTPMSRRGLQLKELLDDDEYKSIEGSRLNAFYTTPTVITAMWDGLSRMGVDKLDNPRVLEPSAGSGRFLGLQPPAMAARSERTAVELDKMTGAILKHTYPDTGVYAGVGFEDATVPDESIDVAISNVPFGDYPVFDKDMRTGDRKRMTRQIHNYFFAKTLDKLRAGGVMAFVTSHSTLDAKSHKAQREYLAARADLVGAIRLPKTAFPDTEVVTDIIYMRKRAPGDVPGDQSWVDTPNRIFQGDEWYDRKDYTYKTEREVPISQYFVDHPENVLGDQSATGSMYGGGEYTVEAKPGIPLGDLLQQATARLPVDIVTAPKQDTTPRAVPTASALNVKEGAFVVDELGELNQKRDGALVRVRHVGDNDDRIRAMLGFRDVAREALNAQVDDLPPEEIAATQAKLTEAYLAFTAKHGAINSRKNVELMDNDPDGQFIRAFERWDVKKMRTAVRNDKRLDADKKADLKKRISVYNKIGNANTLTPDQARSLMMPIFFDRVVKGLEQKTASSITDAYSIAQNETGKVAPTRIAELLGTSEDQARADLLAAGLVYKDPRGAGLVGADEYLTGNVRAKLKDAEIAAAVNPEYASNVADLRPVQPTDIPPSQIGSRLGAPWIPEADVNQFIKDTLDPIVSYRTEGAFFKLVPETGAWVKNEKLETYGYDRTAFTSKWGTPGMPAPKLLEKLLNSQPIEVKMLNENDEPVRDPGETLRAQAKGEELQKVFSAWMWEDPVRAERLMRHYNDNFNNVRPRTFDGSHLTYPGMDTDWADKLHQQQRDGIWRVVQDGTVLLAHEVGFGKSATMIAGAMELRRLGLAKKNMIVVPKSTQAQFVDQFTELYPFAKVLSPEPKDFTTENRGEFISRAATGDWDAIILSGEQYSKIPITPQAEQRFLNEEMNDIRMAMEVEAEAAAESGVTKQTPGHKELEKALKRAETRLKEATAKAAERNDDSIYFEDVGVDQLFVDESDMFKNLALVTKMGRVKGLPGGKGSIRAWDMYSKVKLLRDQGKGRGVVFATGTPIANTVAEMYTAMRYLQPEMLADRKIQNFDAWARTFGQTKEDIEQTVQGTYRTTQRFSEFQNVPELSNLWQQVADIRVAEDSANIVRLRPRLVDDEGRERRHTVLVPGDDALREYMKTLLERADNLPNVEPEEDNMLKIASDARKAALDVRMVVPSAPENHDGKIATVSENVARIYNETTPDKGTQLVFLDLGTPKAKDSTTDVDNPDELDVEEVTGSDVKILDDVYSAIRKRLVQSGIPSNEIAFIHEAKTDPQRLALFRQVNSGAIRVLIGSTGKMGAGVNVQQRAAALHHIDAPWRPRDIEQREGRVIRQGNEVYGPTLNDNGEITDTGRGVRIFNYVTEQSFDEFMWQAIEKKSRAIRSIMKRDASATRTIEDADNLTMSAGEAKAIASGNPDILTLVKHKNDLQRIALIKGSYLDERTRAAKKIRATPALIEEEAQGLQRAQSDVALMESHQELPFAMTINGQAFDVRMDGAKALASALSKIPIDATVIGRAATLGEYKGWTIKGYKDIELDTGYKVLVVNPATGQGRATVGVKQLLVEGAADGLMRRVDNIVASAESVLTARQSQIERLNGELTTAYNVVSKKFDYDEREQALTSEIARLERKLEKVEDEEGVSDEPIVIPGEDSIAPQVLVKSAEPVAAVSSPPTTLATPTAAPVPEPAAAAPGQVVAEAVAEPARVFVPQRQDTGPNKTLVGQPAGTTITVDDVVWTINSDGDWIDGNENVLGPIRMARHIVDKKQLDALESIQPPSASSSVAPTVAPVPEQTPAPTATPTAAAVTEVSPEQQRINDGTKRVGDTYVAPEPTPAPEPTSVDVFTADMTPMAAKRANDALRVNLRNQGRLIARDALVSEKVAGGSDVTVAKSGKRRLVNPDGSYLDESQISKTAMDYAEHLIGQRAPTAEQYVSAADVEKKLLGHPDGTTITIDKDKWTLDIDGKWVSARDSDFALEPYGLADVIARSRDTEPDDVLATITPPATKAPEGAAISTNDIGHYLNGQREGSSITVNGAVWTLNSIGNWENDRTSATTKELPLKRNEVVWSEDGADDMVAGNAVFSRQRMARHIYDLGEGDTAAATITEPRSVTEPEVPTQPPARKVTPQVEAIEGMTPLGVKTDIPNDGFAPDLAPEAFPPPTPPKGLKLTGYFTTDSDVRYELYANTDDDGGRVRIYDTDAREVVGITKYPALSRAQEWFAKYRKLEDIEPAAVVTPTAAPVPAPEAITEPVRRVTPQVPAIEGMTPLGATPTPVAAELEGTITVGGKVVGEEPWDSFTTPSGAVWESFIPIGSTSGAVIRRTASDGEAEADYYPGLDEAISIMEELKKGSISTGAPVPTAAPKKQLPDIPQDEGIYGRPEGTTIVVGDQTWTVDEKGNWAKTTNGKVVGKAKSPLQFGQWAYHALGDDDAKFLNAVQSIKGGKAEPVVLNPMLTTEDNRETIKRILDDNMEKDTIVTFNGRTWRAEDLSNALDRLGLDRRDNSLNDLDDLPPEPIAAAPTTEDVAAPTKTKVTKPKNKVEDQPQGTTITVGDVVWTANENSDWTTPDGGLMPPLQFARKILEEEGQDGMAIALRTHTAPKKVRKPRKKKPVEVDADGKPIRKKRQPKPVEVDADGNKIFKREPITQEEAADHFEDVSKRPQVDNSRQAKRVAPSEPETDADVRRQYSWWNTPNRYDFEGVDNVPPTKKRARTKRVPKR